MNRREKLLFWNRISPLSIGTRVKFVRADPIYSFRGEQTESYLSARIGTIKDYVDQKWKEYMVKQARCYPPEILKETLYVVYFPETKNKTGYAMRITEFEVVDDDK